MRVQQCPYCEHENPVEAKFCNDCGSPLHLKPCPACTRLADSHAVTCPSCGAAFPERPILTVHPPDDPQDDDEPILLTERVDLQGPDEPDDPAITRTDDVRRPPGPSLFDRLAERGVQSASAPAGAPAAPEATVESTTDPTTEGPAAASAQPGRRRSGLVWIAMVLVVAALVVHVANRDRGSRDTTAARPDAPAAPAATAEPPAPAATAAPAAPAATAEPPAPPAPSAPTAPTATSSAPAATPAVAVGPAAGTARTAGPATTAAPSARGPQPAPEPPPAPGRIDCTRAVAALGLCNTPSPKEDE